MTTDRERRVAEKIEAERKALEALADSDFRCAQYADALLAWADNYDDRKPVSPNPAGEPGGGSIGR